MNAQSHDAIQAPIAKAATALVAGTGTSVFSVAASSASFLPQDLGGWLAAGASAAALIYSLTLLAEWWWKRVWKPWLRP